ncbi:imidazole glycerol phosphate synthase subunit HisF [Methanonatronarchaeum sp. AMET-Sl]|uniref:imidazole glycerol phosphate synthase subunit HisF n=1 Tax=Methanonatronarchaeum sp. AMET-Sl TaxID=3037654 RepID=UPI00244D9B15|nr:imidazole glycerol phosphate synthase subunit HisF [Methanonatronarchaeum sp. AMET-Sl]WGI17464.1 imidazole glycerol phosphate synthase subunit HisF [Methanonatronarchaeum sp. AMET-Sl]
MVAKRIIPCLDVKLSGEGGMVVKGIEFKDLKKAGTPVDLAKKYNDQGADELVFLDITASAEGRENMIDVIQKTANEVFIPFTVGGGIGSIEDINRTLRAGADKVGINTAAVKNPDLINKASKKFGSQCIVIAIDAKRNKKPEEGRNNIQFEDGEEGWFEVVIYGGRESTGIDAIDWAREVEERGAGEILLTSMDRDGTKDGYDNELNKAITKATNIPVIASGGAGTPEHMHQAFKQTDVDACLAASIFHYNEYTVKEVKEYLNQKGIETR